MAEKFLQLVGSTPTVKEAKQTSSGVPDAGRILALDDTGHIHISVLPTGIAADIEMIEASENLSSGNFVNIWNDGGTAKVRRADGSMAGKHAHGFVIESFTTGQTASVYFEGRNAQLSGLTPGDVYLSTTPGEATGTAPSGSGQIVQKLGVAVSATSVNVEVGQHYQLS